MNLWKKNPKKQSISCLSHNTQKKNKCMQINTNIHKYMSVTQMFSLSEIFRSWTKVCMTWRLFWCSCLIKSKLEICHENICLAKNKMLIPAVFTWGYYRGMLYWQHPFRKDIWIYIGKKDHEDKVTQNEKILISGKWSSFSCNAITWKTAIWPNGLLHYTIKKRNRSSHCIHLKSLTCGKLHKGIR